MLFSELLDSLDAGSGNRLGQVVHLVLHGITGQVEFRKYQKLDPFLPGGIRLCSDCLQVLFLLSQFRAGLG